MLFAALKIGNGVWCVGPTRVQRESKLTTVTAQFPARRRDQVA